MPARKKLPDDQRRSNGQGTVTYNAARERWEGRVTIGTTTDGRPIRRKVTGATRKVVEDRTADLAAEVRTGAHITRPARLTVGRFLDQWATDVLPGTVALPTEHQYRGLIDRHLCPTLGRHQLTNLTARHVSVMMRDMAGAGYSSTTVRLARAVLRRALRHAEQEGYVTRNVAAIASPPRTVRTEGRTLTRDQGRTLLDAAEGHRLEAAFVVALTCGLRISELLGVSWDDVDLPNAKLKVRRGLKYVPGHGLFMGELKTSRSQRTVVLPRRAVVALTAHRARQVADRLAAGESWPVEPLGVNLVYRATNGEPLDPSNFRKQLSHLSTTAGLGHWHPHELRHSAASLMLASGIPLKVVSETLGHSGIAITADIYAHLLDESRLEAAAAMDRALG